MLIYPWDVLEEGPERVVEQVVNLGVDRLIVATAYHSAEVIAPRRQKQVATVAEANTIHFPTSPTAFTDLAIPHSRIANDHPGLFAELRQRSEEAGIRLTGWGIAFHNSHLAATRPDVSMINCFGDSFSHGICASNPKSQQLAIELFGEIASSGYFDRILVESLSYLLYGHGHPHELWGARLDPTTRYLLSMCFCSFCANGGEQRGIDVVRLKKQVSSELHRTWNVDTPSGRDSDDGSELTSLHMMWPDLARYSGMRMEVVNALAAQVAEAIHKGGALFDLSAAVWARPSFFNWMEGVDVGSSIATADSFVLESYYHSAGEVSREIDHTLAAAALTAHGPEALSVAITLWPSFHPTKDSFLSKVAAISGAGVENLALYNYGTATGASLSWVSDAAKIMHGADR